MSARDWRGLTVAAPGVVLTAALAGVLILTPAGRNPIWPDQRLNLSEAIAASADAEILRLWSARRDVAYEVRPGLLTDRATKATPLESAVLAHRPDYLERLLADRAAPDASTWNHLRCLGGDDVADVLDRHRPPGAEMRCEETRGR